MIQIIAGEKGKGKTKILIEKANSEIRVAKGSIVYLDKNNRHMYELSNKIRLVCVPDYFIENYNEFIGFISGIISQDHDLQALYLDGFFKVTCSDTKNVEYILQKLNKLSNHFKVDIIISISLNIQDLPETVKENVIVSL